MQREIVTDELFLSKPSAPAAAEDLTAAQDLLDTLTANKERCVGMAANMIGVDRRIIAVDDNGAYLLMINPEIIRQSEPYQTEEGCLSLTGVRASRCGSRHSKNGPSRSSSMRLTTAMAS